MSESELRMAEDIDYGKTSEDDHNQFVQYIFTGAFGEKYSKDVSALQETSHKTLMSKNQSLDGEDLWARVMNYDEIPNKAEAKLVQVFLYDRCLKYNKLKSLCNKLMDKEYSLFIKQTDTITFERIEYHALYGKITQCAEFIIKFQQIIATLDLLQRHDYVRLVKMYYSDCKSKLSMSESMQKLVDDIDTRVHKAEIFNKVIYSMVRDLKLDYVSYSEEYERVNKEVLKFKTSQIDAHTANLKQIKAVEEQTKELMQSNVKTGKDNLFLSQEVLFVSVIGIVVSIVMFILQSLVFKK